MVLALLRALVQHVDEQQRPMLASMRASSGFKARSLLKEQALGVA